MYDFHTRTRIFLILCALEPQHPGYWYIVFEPAPNFCEFQKPVPS